VRRSQRCALVLPEPRTAPPHASSPHDQTLPSDARMTPCDAPNPTAGTPGPTGNRILAAGIRLPEPWNASFTTTAVPAASATNTVATTAVLIFVQAIKFSVALMSADTGEDAPGVTSNK